MSNQPVLSMGDHRKPSSLQSERLELAPQLNNVDPDVVLSNGNGIVGFGVQGSGKSTTFKRLLEQIAQKTRVPFVVFDREEDMVASAALFPNGVVGTYENFPSAQDIYTQGLRVVYNLSTWPTRDAAGIMMATLVNDLMLQADKIAPHLRVPCLVCIDEASFWLPQKRGDALEEDTYKLLYNTFEDVATRGRKRGVLSALFCKSISQIHKDVLSLGTLFLMRQDSHTDQARYLEYLLPQGEFSLYSVSQKKQRIGMLRTGEAIVRLASGEQTIAQMYPCESEHCSHTPTALAAFNRYATVAPINQTYGPYVKTAEKKPHKTAERTPVKQKAGREKLAGNHKTGATDRMLALLVEKPAIRPAELASIVGCDPSQASRTRRAHFETLIFALLEKNSDLSPMELAQRLGCDIELAKQIRTDFFTPSVKHTRSTK